MGDFHVDYGQTIFMCSLYIVVGCVSILCSTTTISLYVSSSDLRRKYILYMALDVCELIDAVSYVILGMGRGHALLTGIMTDPITTYGCFFHKYWPPALILGTQLPAVCTLMLSFERILAVVKPATYNLICTQGFKYTLVATLPLFAITTIGLAAVSVLGKEGETQFGSQHCAIITSTAKWYSTFHFIFIVMAYVVSFVSTFVVWLTRRKFSATKYGQEDRLGMILAMSGSSIFLLASPAFVMLTIRWDIAEWGDIEVAITYAMPGLLSIFNTVIAFKFRKDLRQQFFCLLGIKPKVIHYDHSCFTTAQSMRALHSRSMSLHAVHHH